VTSTIFQMPPSAKPRRPHLPLSAFAPDTRTENSFAVPPSPSTLHPTNVIDAHVIASGDDLGLTQWKRSMGQALGGRLSGVVLSLPEGEGVISRLGLKPDNLLISIAIPFNLEDEQQAMPSEVAALPMATSLSTVFSRSSLDRHADDRASGRAAESLRWALQRGRPVDIDIQGTLSDALLEGLEDLLTKAAADVSDVPPIVLSNILPPPHDLDLPIVKLMNHPTYVAFQSQVAALSLFSNVYVKYLPPSWDAPTPPTPSTPSGGTSEGNDSQQRMEWKRRIKMYLGPVMEAFGYERIIFGSSPNPASNSPSNASDWYEIARESLAELGIEQEFVDAVFYGNAKKVYGSK